jgi:hypothetical protein
LDVAAEMMRISCPTMSACTTTSGGERRSRG